MQHLCLIVNAAAGTGRALEREFPLFGFRPYVVESAKAGIQLLHLWRFDVVLIDADGAKHVPGDVPNDDPIATMRKLRRRSPAPVAMLARSPAEASQLAWLQAGASDVVVLPASTQLIATKLKRLVDGSVGANGQPTDITVGPLTMNTWQSTARVDGKPLQLTVHQFELLYMLALRAGQFVHRETIAAGLRSSNARDGRGADVHVYRIRKKLRELEVTGLRLDTVHGRGYCLSIVASRQAEELAERLD